MEQSDRRAASGWNNLNDDTLPLWALLLPLPPSNLAGPGAGGLRSDWEDQSWNIHIYVHIYCRCVMDEVVCRRRNTGSRLNYLNISWLFFQVVHGSIYEYYVYSCLFFVFLSFSFLIQCIVSHLLEHIAILMGGKWTKLKTRCHLAEELVRG